MNRKKHIYKIIHIVFFLMIFLISFYTIDQLFLPKRVDLPWNVTDKVKGFYELPDNSLDVVFIGSSHAFCTINPYIFYKEANIKSYVFSANEQPLWLSYYYMKEAIKHQNPKVIVLETLYISEGDKFKKDGVNKVNIDNIPFSRNKIDMVKIADEKPNILNTVSIYKYHDRWKNLISTDFYSYDYGKLKGFTPLFKSEEKKVEFYDIKPQPLPEKNEEYINKIIQLAKDENVDLIFTFNPYDANKSRQSHITRLKEITKKNNIPFINFIDSTLFKQIDFDPSIDFEGGHTNLIGANKVSKYIANYLKKEYTFDENRDFSDYIEMGEILEAFDSLPKIKNFTNYIDYIKDKDLSIFITAKDEASAKLTNQLAPLGSKIDWKNKSRWSYIGIFQPKKNKVKEYIDSTQISKIFPEYYNQKYHLKLESAGYLKGNSASIYINYNNFLKGKDKRGLNIVVYNEYLKKVVDVASFDTHESANPVRKN